jgi:hypothetical protein
VLFESHGYEVLRFSMAVSVYIPVFSSMTPCNLVGGQSVSEAPTISILKAQFYNRNVPNISVPLRNMAISQPKTLLCKKTQLSVMTHFITAHKESASIWNYLRTSVILLSLETIKIIIITIFRCRVLFLVFILRSSVL